jgi:hypothetical protein
MGNNLATELADGTLGLDMESAIGMHLRVNHYPPVPLSMVQPCLDAIDAYHDEAYDRLIKLPEGVSWRGEDNAPASAIAEAHHLDAWLPHAHYCDCEECVYTDEE